MPLALLTAAPALQAVANRNPELVERYYSLRLFPPIIHVLSLINGVVGFSIAELLIYVLVAALAGTVIYQAIVIYLRRRRISAVLRTDLLAVIWISGSALMLLLLMWGLNYQRVPLAGQLRSAGRNASVEQFKTISEIIVTEINANYDASHFGDAAEGSPSGAPTRAQIYELIESAYQHEPLVGNAGSGRYGPPKPIYFSGILNRFGLSGFYMPFTGEPHFNDAQPYFDLPFVIAHEKAHQRGFAREDEANFIAFLVCINSADPYVRYSGYLNVVKVAVALYNSDPEFYKHLTMCIGEGPRNDLRARAAFWARTKGTARYVAVQVNNTYLKANRIPSGARSYSEDVALIVGYYLMQAQNDHK
ncbi:MAG: DUF3810 domain-containing protein [Acidobacteriota bacterium]